jgi:hypothetical protein
MKTGLRLLRKRVPVFLALAGCAVGLNTAAAAGITWKAATSLAHAAIGS